jgi:hypothetical protein
MNLFSSMKPVRLKLDVNTGTNSIGDLGGVNRQKPPIISSSFLKSTTKLPIDLDGCASRPTNPRLNSGASRASMRKSLILHQTIQPVHRTSVFSATLPIKPRGEISRSGPSEIYALHDRSPIQPNNQRDASCLPEQSLDLIKLLGSNHSILKEADIPYFGDKHHHIRSGSKSPQVEYENELMVMREFAAIGLGLGYVPPNIFRIKGLRVRFTA